MESDLEWLPEKPDWQQALASARARGFTNSAELFHTLNQYRALANSRLDLALTARLDRALQADLSRAAREQINVQEFTWVRLAVLGSSTLSHLLPGIRVAGLRRGLVVEVYEAPFGTWRQELADPASGLHTFRPEVVLLAIDARSLAGMEKVEGPGSALRTLQEAWREARDTFGCAVIQQTALPVFPPRLGHAEHLLPESPAAFLTTFNAELPAAAAKSGDVHLLKVDALVLQQGLQRWHSPALWFRAKQEIHPAMSPLYGEHVARILAALLGRTAKCLVLDLDHTLWGGGIGDDGLDGIVIGQGSALGEAHLELQRYALALRDRGIILAVCSKNEPDNAILPFQKHPDMLLRPSHIACFVANWEDKATNLRRIARDLNLSLDALVFVDDNPAERGLVQRELPQVHVPELPDDPAEFVPTLAAAGYFESVVLTDEDRSRAAVYAVPGAQTFNRAAENSESPRADLNEYLASLMMELEARPLDNASRSRVVQLINKTNQFNLTTRRVLNAEVARLGSDPNTIALQLRLRDIYGDHGMIAVVVAEPGSAQRSIAQTTGGPGDLLITQWLMSCRVLGRQIENATMNLLVESARAHGAHRLLGIYLPTTKNGMVRDLYGRTGFTCVQENPDGSSIWALDVEAYDPLPSHVAVKAEALTLQPLSSTARSG